MTIRPTYLALGLAVLAAAWFGPLPGLAARAFSAHMTLHIAVVAIAAPLLACAVAGGRLDPVCRAPGAFPAIPLSLAELIAVWSWHAPALHQFARSSPIGLVLEQATFLLAGGLVWIAAIGGGAALRSARVASGVTSLLLTAMHMTLLGALLALTPRPLYGLGASADVCGATSLQDVHLGGAIMILVGGVAYLAGGLGLTAAVLRDGRPVSMEGAR